MNNGIYFYTGAMNCGKTAAVVQTAYNYMENQTHALVIKPAFDTRDGNPTTIQSRSGAIWKECVSLPLTLEGRDLVSMLEHNNHLKKIDAIVIDEVQFLSLEQIKAFYLFCFSKCVPLIAYGLRNSFTGEGFPASDWLLQNGKTTVMKSVCWCKSSATHNMLLLDGVPYNPELHGELNPMRVGGNESYRGVCLKHFMLRQSGAN